MKCFERSNVEGLEPPSARIGDNITQPGVHGGGTVPQDVIATLSDWIRLKPTVPGSVNFYDCAMAEITNDNLSSANPYEVTEIGRVEGTEDIDLGDKVMKRGRTTHKTVGRVVAVDIETTVDYQGMPCNFSDQVVIVGIPETTPFSLSGDSGSVILSAEKNIETNAFAAKALLFAGGQSDEGIDLTIASPIKRIASDFNLRF